MANPKNPAWYGGGLAGFLKPGANQGNIYYIDGTGPDTQSGLTPDDPLASFSAALALCVNDQNDTIVVLDYWNAATEAAWPIVVNKSMVHIIGVPGQGAIWPQVNPTGDFAAFNVTAAMVEICNLGVIGGATHGAIEIGAAIWGTEIHHCSFGEVGGAQDGIRVVVPNDAAYLKVWACRFGALLTRSGVRIDHNATRGMIGVPGVECNRFYGLAGPAIHATIDFAEGGIYDNRIKMGADTQGLAITLDATVVGGVHVDGNSANFGDTVCINNPYLDSAVAVSNHWGLNYWGTAPTMPA